MAHFWFALVTMVYAAVMVAGQILWWIILGLGIAIVAIPVLLVCCLFPPLLIVLVIWGIILMRRSLDKIEYVPNDEEG